MVIISQLALQAFTISYTMRGLAQSTLQLLCPCTSSDISPVISTASSPISKMRPEKIEMIDSVLLNDGSISSTCLFVNIAVMLSLMPSSISAFNTFTVDLLDVLVSLGIGWKLGDWFGLWGDDSD